MFELGTRVAMVDDLVLAERFYAELLGEKICGRGSIDTRYMLSTDEFLESRRRTSSRERSNGESDFWVNRPPHSNVTIGEAKVSLYLADHHIQEPPPEQLRGAPRLALTATAEQMERAVTVLQSHGVPFEGPVRHAPPCPAVESVYFRDPAGNFLELCRLSDD